MPDYIDTCIFLAVILMERDAQRCRTYLSTVGYRQHPIGCISYDVLGELFGTICRNVDKMNIRYIGGIATELLALHMQENRLELCSGEHDSKMIGELCEIEYGLSADDARHLCAAITAGCRRFVTIDRLLLKSMTLQRLLVQKYRLRIVAVS